MRFWVSATSLLFAGVAMAQPFGRFGYRALPLVPGFEIDRAGFRAKLPGAPALRFEQPSTYWKPVATSHLSQTAMLSGFHRAPTKFRCDLLAPGFLLHFNNGLRFKFASREAPYLTWNEGSVGTDVPTPAVRWAVLSFKEHVPPIALGFLDGEASVVVKGRRGDWSIESSATGWVRVALPYGTMPVSTESISKLGAISALMKRHDRAWWQKSPELDSVTSTQDATSCTVSWTFDQPFAVVPSPVILAPIAGYRVSAQTPLTRLDGFTEEGPLAYCVGNVLTVRFPVRRIGTGRALAVGTPKDESLASVSPFDAKSVAELALHNLMGRRDRVVRSAVADALGAYLADSSAQPEPHTGQPLLYQADGTGLDLVGAAALLSQSKESAESAEPPTNPFLVSLGLRRDWASWSILGVSREKARRAASCAAIASLLTESSVDEAAVWEAGLAGERGLNIFLRRKGRIAEEAVLAEPLRPVRQSAFFTASGQSVPPLPFSPIRLYGDRAMRITGSSPSYRFAWNAAAENFSFVLSGPIVDAVPEQNVESTRVTRFAGIAVIDCVSRAEGEAAITVTVEEGIGLPKMEAWPSVEW